MTNREWLNSLSDEEFAKFYNDGSHCPRCAYEIPEEVECSSCYDCLDGQIKWLKQEHQVDTTTLLTEKEKEYLRSVIKPIRDKVIYIAKCEIDDGEYEYIEIQLCDHDNSGIYLYSFEPNTEYQGLELHKCYTLEELGI